MKRRPGARIAAFGFSLPLVLAASGAGQDRHGSPATTLDDLLARAATYVRAYERTLSSVVAEERYEQRVRRLRVVGDEIPSAGTGGIPITSRHTRREETARTLRSDFLLVKTEGMDGWIPFRDVFEVDGASVRDREERVADLFRDSPPAAVERASRLVEESARYNLGNLSRTINVPTLALLFLIERHQQQFVFRLEGRETIDGAQVRKVTYRETARPTLVRSPTGVDLPVHGAFWLDPLDGRVARSELRTEVPGLDATIVVDFAFCDALETWVPARMKEEYRTPEEDIEGAATYTEFRRLSMNPGESIRD